MSRAEADARPASQTAVGLVLAVVALVTYIGGRPHVSLFVGVLCVIAFGELRTIIVPSGRLPTLLAGGAAVVTYMWFGYRGSLTSIPWTAAGLVLVLLGIWVVLHEASGRATGATDDIAGTLAASAIVGVLGAHILLIRAVPRFGPRGLLAFGLMVLLNDAFAMFGDRAFGRRPLTQISSGKTVEGAVCGFVASVAVGLVFGLAADPPFDPVSGLAFGAAMGALAPIGDVAFSALKRAAGREASGRSLGPLGGALDTIDTLLFCAPAFYWAFRTIAL